MWLITVSVSNKLYTLSNLCSAIVICEVSVVKLPLSSRLNRFRIGHTRLTLAFISSYSKRPDQPKCFHCDCALTVTHVLLQCSLYSTLKQRYFNDSTLKELFYLTWSTPMIFLVIGYYTYWAILI